MPWLVVLLAMLVAGAAHAEGSERHRSAFVDSFRQLDGELWPAGNDYRTASGAPGHRYWQQRVDYDIDVRLDEQARSLSGTARIVYRNNSPDALGYLWLLLDQNVFKRDSVAELARPVSGAKLTERNIRRALRQEQGRGGFTIESVRDSSGRALAFTVVDSLMRVELPSAVTPGGGEFIFSVAWSLPLVETINIYDRSGYECFSVAEGGSCIFQAGQWFPRLAAYSDYEGWHNKAFLGVGEFALEFGDYRVTITVPADHLVSATGELSNASDVLTNEQRSRLAKARTSSKPVYIVTPQEAAAAERGRLNCDKAIERGRVDCEKNSEHGRGGEKSKTWLFVAKNVRDFAWASSRKFIWDAMGVRQDSSEQPLVMAMSFYPSVASSLWDGVSTQAIADTLHSFSELTFPYPYPVAQSVNGPVGAAAPNGVEYPMISFNGSRLTQGTDASKATTLLIDTVIHEVGHNYLPMIVNSDERQWAWMDEGLTTYLQFRTLQRLGLSSFDGQGQPRDVIAYMLSPKHAPIMTQPDALPNYGRGAYTKPGTALMILRDTVLGPELFDRAFREYAQRWRFKRPTPYDFFRTMEESSGVDLDWFWRGWFYSTQHVDIAIEAVTRRRAQEKNFYWLRFRNVGGVVMPILLDLTFDDGSTETVRIPAEIWRRSAREVTWQYVTAKTLSVAEIDPRQQTADSDSSNNRYSGSTDADMPQQELSQKH
ncbi:M1 family metallopeptidase [Steroidobacter sp.]|uniref:M1 family metallopeptidase n=1 Tax=Steroidobacter sp. TaxID=1978227 RepID=UPI001A400D14|nr:M1 family metallopeptidase [Steroidobacter sp.]MBL8267045.1 M1 family metallopeptidase [Steroidobacter sp.]